MRAFVRRSFCGFAFEERLTCGCISVLTIVHLMSFVGQEHCIKERNFMASRTTVNLLLAFFSSFAPTQLLAEGMDGWHDVPPLSQTRYLIQDDKVISIENISMDCGDLRQERTAEGRVVHVKYSEDGLTIRGATIEYSPGNRGYINVDEFQGLNPKVNRLDLAWLSQGMMQMLVEENKLAFGILLCGASGGVVMLDDVRYLR